MFLSPNALFDSEFLGLSLVFILIGAAGIILFYGPMNSAGDSCYCLIPSPEPGAAQGTSSIFLVLGLMFFPMGLMKGGLPSFGRSRLPLPTAPISGGVAVPPAHVANGGLLWTGIVLVLVGIDALFVPGYLVFNSVLFEAAGAAVAGLGAFAAIRGLRRPD